LFDRKVWKNCLFRILFLCLFASPVWAYSDGTGTSGDPYQIADLNDLLALAAAPADYGKCFVLTADIDMAGQVFTTAIIAPDTSSSSDFQGTAFTGTFDGSGHKITHFIINGGSNDYIGLFGYINSGSVKNLGIENFSVNGASYIGGLVGNNGSGSITNCYSTGTVSGDQYVGGLVGCNGLVWERGYGGNITNCYSTGNVCGYYYIGGLVGYNSGSITNCYSTGAVLGSGWLGGLVGYNKSSISKSYSTGIVIGYDQYLGGLVGYNDNGSSTSAVAIITNCYSTGAVDGSWTSYVGGLVGYNYSTSWPNPTPILIRYCYSTGAVNGIGSSYVGGLTGYGWASASFWDVNTSGRSSSAGGTGKTTAQMKTLSTFTAWDFITVWDINDGWTYPYLFKKTSYSGGNGTPAAPYQIANVEDLLTLAANVADYNKCFIQTADINMAGRTSSMALIAASTGTSGGFQGTAFTGTFDGNDHKITHFTINGGSNIRYLGLFGRIDNGSVKNLGVENFSVSGSFNSFYVGGLAGRSYNSNIINCYSIGTVSGSAGSQYIGGLAGSNSTGSSITNSYSTGVVGGASGSLYVGGLVGYNGYNISNCYSTATVNGSSGSSYIGGLIGYNYSSVTDSYSTGAVSGASYVGGLVGYSSGGTTNNSFWDVNSSGLTTSAGGTGKTTAQMQDTNTFLNAGWDFVGETVNGTLDYWTQGSAQYPYLTWQTDIATVPNVVSMTQADAENAIVAAGLVVGTITNSYSNTVPDGYIVSQSLVAGIIVPNGTPVNIVVSLGKIYSGGDGTEKNPYKIANVSDWNDLMKISLNWDKYFILIADINLQNVSLTPVGNSATYFTGIFDGQNHTIFKFDLYSTSNYIGLFGCIGSGCSVKNLGIENFSVSSSSYNQDVGGLVGLNNGHISNCYSNGTVIGYSSNCIGGLVGGNDHGNISNCYSSGKVIGSGGLVGGNSGNISSCYSISDVNGSSTCTGGLVGVNVTGGNIINCYSTGSVISNYDDIGGLVGVNDNGYITNCYSIGLVKCNGTVFGGFAGATSVSGIASSFWDVNTSGCTTGGAIGRTTAQMKTESTFTSAGWDFSYADGNDAVWFMAVDGYPILTWQISPADLYTDGKNNFRDFAVFAQYWMRDDCRMYNNFCDWSDLNFDGSVDIDDLIEFMNYWLQLGIYE
jgi:hypothetical protein